MYRFIATLTIGTLCLLSKPSLAEGPGIKLGDALVLHVGALAGAGHDSNMFYASGDGPYQPLGVPYFIARPTIDLSTLPAQRGGGTPHSVDFRLHLGSQMRFLLTGDAEINRHYSIDLDSGFLLSLFPFGNYSVDLFDNFTRISTPPYALSGGKTFPTNINSDQNQVGLRFRIRPGGQRLEIALQYMFAFNLFEQGQFTGKNDLMNDIQLRIAWKFLPKTAIYLNGTETTHTFYNNTPSTPPSAYPLRVVAGMIGLITPTLTVDLNIGYGNGLQQSNANYPNSASYNMVIGMIQGTWKPTLNTVLTLGYRHDFAQSLIGTYYDLDNAFLSFMQQVWRFSFLLRGGWERRGYHGDLSRDSLSNNEFATPSTQRIDNLLVGSVQIDFHPAVDWLVISVGDDIGKNFANCVPTSGVFISATVCSYFRNEVWGRLGIQY